MHLAKEAARNGLLLDTVSNSGTEETLENLRDGKLDLAIVSSGVAVPDAEDLMVLGAIQVEALHVLVRKELADATGFGGAIRGKRVNVGVKGTTEHLLALDFLKFSHLSIASPSHPGDVIDTQFSKTELVEKAQVIQQTQGPAREKLIAELPDCILLLDSTPATAVQELIQAADYRLLPQPATRAYIADSLQDGEVKSTSLLREFLEPTSILAKSYFKTEGHPETDCETVGVRLLIVARKTVPVRAIRLLMRTLFEGDFARRIRTKSPRDLATTFPIHPGAIAYLDRDKPLPINDVIGWMKDGFSLFGAFSALALSLYGLLWRKKSRKPSDYYAAIRRIELLAQGADVVSEDEIRSNNLSAYLEDRLETIRRELIGDICEGRIRGEQVITNILALIKEARLNLHRAIPLARSPASQTDRDDNSSRAA
ncbi:MAG: TAXI family TRAP transporter solute-binding subunit [Isosphaeraceae bacterium]